jgi:hypothetical protein
VRTFELGSKIMITNILSGAQTCSDLDCIDAPIETGIPYGDWIPKGRKVEDGTLPDSDAWNPSSDIGLGYQGVECGRSSGK